MLNDFHLACDRACRAGEQVRHLDDMIGRAVRDKDAGHLRRTPAQMAADFGRKDAAATGNLNQADAALRRSLDALAKGALDPALSAPAGRAVRAAASAVQLVNSRLPAIQAGASELLSGNVDLGAAMSSAAASVSDKLGLASLRIGTQAGAGGAARGFRAP